MSINLSEGSIQVIMNGGTVDQPILQILGYKKIPGGASDRYRMMISDGRALHSFAMLATQLNSKITSGELDNNAVVRLDKYICNSVNSGADASKQKKVIIILELTVLCPGQEIGGRLGNPEPIGEGQTSKPSTANLQNGISSAAVPKKTIQKSAPMDHSQGPPSMVHPIASLTPYQNKWTVRARVANKSNIKTWSNSRGEGKLFSIDLVDESGEIRATAFNEVCDKFFDMMEANKVYYIHKANLKSANKQFTSIKNDYEMTFNNDTQVIPCFDDCTDIPVVQFNFVNIDQLPNLDKDHVLDIIGVCRHAQDLQTIIQRTTSKEVAKRDIALVDNTGHEVNMTLWAKQAEDFNASNNPVVAVKGAKLSDYNGRSLSVLTSSMVQINPDIPEAHMLRGWYDSDGCSMPFQSVSSQMSAAGSGSSQLKTLGDAKVEQLGFGDKPDFYTCKATVLVIKKDNALYMACPKEDCNKKVIDQANGRYRCEKCNKEYPEFKYRMLLQVNIADFSDIRWVTCFQDTAEAILGITTAELGQVKDSGDEEAYTAKFQQAYFKSHLFKLRVKMENYNDESRLKTTGVESKPINFNQYNKFLISEIKELSSK